MNHHLNRLITIIVLIAVIILIALAAQGIGEKHYGASYSPEYAALITPKNDTPENITPAPSEDEIVQSLASEQQDLVAQSARLKALTEAPSPEKIAVSQKAVIVADANLYTAEKTALAKAIDALAKTDAIIKKLQDAQVPISQTLIADSIQAASVIKHWQAAIDASSAAAPLSANQVNDYLQPIQQYISEVVTIVTGISSTTSGVTQTQINDYISTVNTAATQVGTASTNVSTSGTASDTAHDNLTVATSAGDPQAIQQQVTVVAQTQAAVDALQNQLTQVQQVSSTTSTGGTQFTPTDVAPPPSPKYDPTKPKLLQGWTD